MWEIIAKYDGGPNPIIKKPTGSAVAAAFARNKPTVDDDGAPVAANVRRFTKEPVGIAGHVDWQPAHLSTGGFANLGASGLLLGSGPSLDHHPLLVGLDINAGTMKVFEFDDATATLSLESTTPWSSLPGTQAGVKTYMPRSACVWYGLIVIYAERSERPAVGQPVQPVGITLFYSQNKGVNWFRVENSAIDGGGFDVPVNSVAAPYATDGDPEIEDDSNKYRGNVWAGSKPFPANGIDENGNFLAELVYFPWVDYVHQMGALPTDLQHPRGYQAGLFAADLDPDTEIWSVRRNRVIAERWHPDVEDQHGHTAHIVGGGAVVWYGDTSPNNGADYIAFDVENYETDDLTVTQHWHGGVGTTPPVPGHPLHARNSLQPVSAAPAPGRGTLMAGDTFLEPIVRLEDAASASTPPKLTPRVYMLSDRKSGFAYAGWEPLWLQWYPGKGWVSGGADSTLKKLGASTEVPTVDPLRHYSDDGQTFAALPNSDRPRGFICILGDHLAALGAPEGIPAVQQILIAPTPTIKKIRPLRINPGGDNLLGSLAVGETNAPSVAPTPPNRTRQAVWDETTDMRFEYADDGMPVDGAPATPAPLNNPKYVLLSTQSTTSENQGWWWIQDVGGEVFVNKTLHMPIYVATCNPKLSLDFTTTAGHGGEVNRRTLHQHFIPGCNQGWFACPHFGVGTTTPPPESVPPPTDPDRSRMQFLAGHGGVKPNRGNVIVALGGLYNSDLAIWPTAPGSTGNPHERESISGLWGPNPAWSLAVTLLRPNMSQTLGASAKTPAGTLFTAFRDQYNFVMAKWHPDYFIDIYTIRDGSMIGNPSLRVPVGHWFRTWPMTIIISDNGSNKLEATALSPRFGLVEPTAASTYTLGGKPTQVLLHEPMFGASGGAVYNVEVCVVAYDYQFRDQAARQAALTSLDFFDTE